MDEKIDSTDFGFETHDEVSQATLGLLKHLQRLGLSVVPRPENGDVLDDFLNIPGTEAALKAFNANPAVESAAKTESTDSAAPPAMSGKKVVAPPAIKLPVAVPHSAPVPTSIGAAQYSLPVLPFDDRTAALDDLRRKVSSCRQCAELVISRRQTVFGEGSALPRVCFFGEAPGADEDRTGRPFVGQAGQLLTKMIEACTFKREECYILNTVKCRPPGNRNPTLDEVSNCRGYFEHQLELLQPEYIVCLGLVAARALLQSTTSVGLLRGHFHHYRASKVLVTYHPAYLLRNPDAKRAAWEDLQMLLRDMGIDPKARR
jgi:uracil-DNA glycosylase